MESRKMMFRCSNCGKIYEEVVNHYVDLSEIESYLCASCEESLSEKSLEDWARRHLKYLAWGAVEVTLEGKGLTDGRWSSFGWERV